MKYNYKLKCPIDEEILNDKLQCKKCGKKWTLEELIDAWYKKYKVEEKINKYLYNTYICD